MIFFTLEDREVNQLFSGAGGDTTTTTTNGDPTQPRRTSTETRVISSPTSHQRGGSSTGATSLVNLTPLPVGGTYANVNPAMNLAGNVQVMSVLEVPPVSNVFEQFDMGLMEGLPRGLFDWCEYPLTGLRQRYRLMILSSTLGLSPPGRGVSCTCNIPATITNGRQMALGYQSLIATTGAR